VLKPRSHCPGVCPGASRQFAAGGPGRTGTNREGIRVRSYIPGSATDQTRFGAKITVCPENAMVCRCIPGVAAEALRYVPVRPDTPRFCPENRRQSLGVTTASLGSRTAEPRFFTVAYEY